MRFVRRDDWGVRLASVPSGSQNLTHEDNCTRRGGKAQVKRQRLLGQMQMTMRERACRGKAVAVRLVRKKKRKGGERKRGAGGEAQSYPSPSEHPPDGYGAVDGPPRADSAPFDACQRHQRRGWGRCLKRRRRRCSLALLSSLFVGMIICDCKSLNGHWPLHFPPVRPHSGPSED